jgi:hypothetical protein
VKLLGKTAWFALSLIFTAGLIPLYAQTGAGTASAGTSSVDEIQFPQWSKDLRRGEIIAFGTLPFSWLVSTIAIDISRTIAHNGDQRYLPWPLKPAGAPAMSNDEFIMSIGVAVGISALAAIVDHIIIKYKRKKAAELKLANSPQEPIIIRRPIESSEYTANSGNTE